MTTSTTTTAAATTTTTTTSSNQQGPLRDSRPLGRGVWTLQRREAGLTEEQRKVLRSWDSGALGGDRLLEVSLRLDRTDTLVAQSIVANQERQSHYQGDAPEAKVHESASASGSGDAERPGLVTSVVKGHGPYGTVGRIGIPQRVRI